MMQTAKPHKRQVRASVDQRIYPQHEDPPTPDEIRREMGWDLTPHIDDTNEQP